MPPVTRKNTKVTRKIQPSGRSAGHSVRRSSPRSPAIHTSAISGLKISRVSSDVLDGAAEPPYSSLMSAESSKTGQPCWPARAGSAATAAAPPARRPTTRRRGGGDGRRGSAATPTNRPSRQTTMSCLAFSPTPATSPAASHSRGRSSHEGVRRDQERWPSRPYVEALRGQPVAEERRHGRGAGRPPRSAPAPGCRHRAAARGRPTSRRGADGEHAGQPQQPPGCAAASSWVSPGEQRHQRRLVGIAPGEAVAGRGEVELVAVGTVRRREHQQDEAERAAPRPARPARANGGRSTITQIMADVSAAVTRRTTSASSLSTSRSQVSRPLSSSSTSLSWV